MATSKSKAARGRVAKPVRDELTTQAPALPAGAMDGSTSDAQWDAHLAELEMIFTHEKNPMIGLYAAQLAIGQERPLLRSFGNCSGVPSSPTCSTGATASMKAWV